MLKKKETITIKRFDDERPKENIEYFKKSLTKDELAVVIPFYNEESKELETTLKSLYGSYDYLCEIKKEWRDKQIHVLIVQDGWYKSSETMKSYLKEIFPKKYSGIDWWNYYPEFKEYSKEKNGSVTYIFENEDYTCFNPKEDKYNKLYLKLTLLIKMDNRRKHNSHEWFLGKSAFGEASCAKYLFFTDAFTIFGQSCLYHLVNKLDNDDKCSAATGRQRVMTRYQQETDENPLGFSYLLRMVQLYDFELANAVYNGAFSIGGCLPVIPGPCGLYRASDVLQDKVRNWYFDTIHVEAEDTSMILGNLKIAEDRILTYASVLKTNEERHMAFVPLSVFYFEGELNLKNLMLQRRRWINGSVAGYLYLLLTDNEHIRNWKTNIIRKLYIYFLLFCQLLIYFAVSLAPSFSLGMLTYGVTYIFSVYEYKSPLISYITGGIGWLIYLLHVIIHSRNSFNKIIMYLLVLLSFVTTIVSTTAIITFYLIAKENINIVTMLTIIVFLGPMILAMFLSLRGHSFWLMIRAFIPYILFIHMLISWFGSYSFSRLWDLSWGNRPPGEMSEKERICLDEKKKKYKIYNILIVIILLILNFGVYILPRKFQINILSFFFICVIIQMIFSLIYMIIQIPSKLLYSRNYINNFFYNSEVDNNLIKNNEKLENNNEKNINNNKNDKDVFVDIPLD